MLMDEYTVDSEILMAVMWCGVLQLSQLTKLSLQSVRNVRVKNSALQNQNK